MEAELKSDEAVSFGSIRILAVIEQHGDDKGKMKLIITDVGVNRNLVIKPRSANSISVISDPRN